MYYIIMANTLASLLTQVYSRYSCEKPPMERVIVKSG